MKKQLKDLITHACRKEGSVERQQPPTNNPPPKSRETKNGEGKKHTIIISPETWW